MKKLWLILATLVVVALIVLITKKTDKNESMPKNDKIIAFGDSLVAGYGSTPGNDFVSVLSDRIGKPIINMGVNGDTTEGALDRIDTVTDQNPGIVILVIGGNDILRRVSIATTRENIEKIISTLQANGATVVLVGVRGGLLNDPYKEMYRSLAQKYRTFFIPDILEGLFGNSKYMYDTVHPNDLGYKQIAERMTTILEAILI